MDRFTNIRDIPWDTLLGPAIAAGIVLLAAILWTMLARRRDLFPYEPRDSLMTDSELQFFEILEQAVAYQYRIYSKVRLEDIIQVRAGTDHRTAFAARNRIKSRHLDFVLCDPETLEIIASIELDDRSHERPDRIERDEFVDEALRVCGIPCIRFPVQREYRPIQIRSELERLI